MNVLLRYRFVYFTSILILDLSVLIPELQLLKSYKSLTHTLPNAKQYWMNTTQTPPNAEYIKSTSALFFPRILLFAPLINDSMDPQSDESKSYSSTGDVSIDRLAFFHILERLKVSFLR